MNKKNTNLDMDSAVAEAMANLMDSAMVEAKANLVPMDEQAVESVVACEDKVVTLDVFDPYTSILSEEDMAVEPEETSNELSEADKRGFFSPVIGMARLTNTLGGKFFAQIRIDEKGNRRIEFCQAYENGGFSPKITIRQSDFLRAVSYKFGEANIPQKKLKNEVEDFILRLSSECLDKFDGAMSFDVVKVLKAIGMCYRELPVYQDMDEEQSPAEFYRSIMEVLKENHCMDDDAILYGHKGYFPLDGQYIRFIAEKLEMRKTAFLKKLRECNFLYLTDSSVGYQTNVRIKVEEEDGFKTYTERRYCLLRLENLESK